MNQRWLSDLRCQGTYPQHLHVAIVIAKRTQKKTVELGTFFFVAVGRKMKKQQSSGLYISNFRSFLNAITVEFSSACKGQFFVSNYPSQPCWLSIHVRKPTARDQTTVKLNYCYVLRYNSKQSICHQDRWWILEPGLGIRSIDKWSYLSQLYDPQLTG